MQMPQEAEHADGVLDHVSHEFFEHKEVFVPSINMTLAICIKQCGQNPLCSPS